MKDFDGRIIILNIRKGLSNDQHLNILNHIIAPS
jgi:hypothetical protein